MPDSSLTDSANETENDDLRNCHYPEGLIEVQGILHLGNETWQRNLPYEGVADVEKGVHPRDKGGARGWNHQNNRSATLWLMLWVRVIHIWMSLNSRKDCGKHDANECEECGKRCQLRERIEGPR